MLKIYSGKMRSIGPKTTKGGASASVVDLELQKWDSNTNSYVPSETISVWYCGDTAKRVQHILNNQSAYINQTVIMMVNEEIQNGKASYFGRLSPTKFGILRVPAQLNPEATDEDYSRADEAVEDCIDAGELDPTFTLDYQDAEAINTTIAILSGSYRQSQNDVAKTARDALYKLIVQPSAAYIGKMLSFTIYDDDKKGTPNVDMSFTIPVAGGQNNTQWAHAKVYKPKQEDAKRPSAYTRLKTLLNKNVLKKSDRVVLFLQNEQVRNGEPSFTCTGYQRL